MANGVERPAMGFTGTGLWLPAGSCTAAVGPGTPGCVVDRRVDRGGIDWLGLLVGTRRCVVGFI